MIKEETWFIVEGMAGPISADNLQSYYPIVKVIKGSYEDAVKVFNRIFYGVSSINL